MSEALVVIGNGMAAACFVEELSKKALVRYAIAIIGEGPRLAYNRVPLSSVLSADIDQGDKLVIPTGAHALIRAGADVARVRDELMFGDPASSRKAA